MARNDSPKERKQFSWVRLAVKIVLWGIPVLLILLLIAYAVVTSPGFLKSVVLPRVGAALHVNITAADVAVHPFSEVTVHGLKVQAEGQEPILTAQQFHVRYNLWSIMGGNLRISEVVLASPVISLVENPDGTHNWDALKPSPVKAPPPAPSEKARASSKAPQLDVGKVTISDATFRQVKIYSASQRDVLEVSGAKLTLANLKRSCK